MTLLKIQNEGSKMIVKRAYEHIFKKKIKQNLLVYKIFFDILMSSSFVNVRYIMLL